MKFLLSFFFLMTSLYSLTMTITPQQLQAALQQKFPIEKSLLFAKIIVQNPAISIQKGDDSVTFSADVYTPNIVLNNGQVAVFRVFASTGIRYAHNALFFKNIHIEKIRNKDLSQKAEFQLKQALEIFLNIYFEKNPVYSFDKNDAASQIFGGLIKNIRVKNGNIEVILG